MVTTIIIFWILHALHAPAYIWALAWICFVVKTIDAVTETAVRYGGRHEE